MARLLQTYRFRTLPNVFVENFRTGGRASNPRTCEFPAIAAIACITQLYGNTYMNQRIHHHIIIILRPQDPQKILQRKKLIKKKIKVEYTETRASMTLWTAVQGNGEINWPQFTPHSRGRNYSDSPSTSLRTHGLHANHSHTWLNSRICYETNGTGLFYHLIIVGIEINIGMSNFN